MAYIFVDRESESGGQQMRQQMRRSMRNGGYRGGYRYDGGASMRENYNYGYRQGYKHGWEDHEDEMYGTEDEMDMRRARDSRGRFV